MPYFFTAFFCGKTVKMIIDKPDKKIYIISNF